MTNILTVLVAGNPVSIQANTPKISQKLDQPSTCNFAVLDMAGTANYFKGQQVTVNDSVRGTLFTGYLNKPQARDLYPQPVTLWTCDCTDQTWLLNKRTSNSIYANQYAATILCDQMQNILAAEGLSGQYALDYNHYETDWSAGGATLSGVVAAANAGDGNVGDGDLELAPAGTMLSYTDNFAAGTLTNVQDNSGALELASSSALKLTGTAAQGSSNPFAYMKCWTGSYTIASGDSLQYQEWIASSSPAQKAGVDGVCSDGTTLRDYNNGGAYLEDGEGLRAHPNTDLSGFATDTWYFRQIDLSNLSGKSLSYVTVALEGDAQGDYAAYFRYIKIMNGGSTKLTIYTSGAPQTTAIAGINAYSNVALSAVTVYELSGTRTAPSISVGSVGIAKTSQVSWVAPTITTTATVNGVTQTVAAPGSTLPTVDVQTSIDNGATWQSCTNYGAIPNLQAGMTLTGRNLQLRQVYTMAGTDPTLTPTLTALLITIQPTYNATKSDVIQTEQTQGDWNSGSLSQLRANSDNTLTLNQNSRDWHTVTNLSDQTVFGPPSDAQQAVSLGQLQLSCNGSNEDCRSRQDWAGQWQDFTAEIDIDLGSPVVNLLYGLEYRTTYWSNNLNSFAWTAYFIFTNVSGAGNLVLGYGMNGPGSTFTPVQSVPIVNVSSGSKHRLKVIASGANHQVYLDDVLYINVTNSTYQSQSGYLCARFYNNSGSRHSGDFAYFGVCQALSGTYTSTSQSLSAAGTLGSSLLQWQETDDPSGQTYLVVSTSVNGGGTWQTATNGGPIPSLTVGQSLSGVSLLVQVQFSSPAANLTPVLSGLTAWVVGQFNASGHWTSPSLALTNVGRAGASLVSWNAILPNSNTTLSVKTSVDGGVTYQTVSASGNAIAGITAQPTATADTFATNTSANYTSTDMSGGLGGIPASWTWDTTNVRLTVVGGTNALLLVNSLTVADVDLLCDTDYADAGGLVWRAADVNDFYVLVIHDASNGLANTAVLQKATSGTLSTLATGTISFPRNSHHRVRVTMLGSVITASFDGVQVLTYTDSSPIASGQCGLYNTAAGGGSSAHYSTLRIQPQGQTVSSMSVLTKLTLTSTDPLNTPQVTDVATLVTGTTMGLGALVPTATYQRTFCGQNFNDLKKQSDYFLYVTQGRQVQFLPRAAQPAPWVIDSANASVAIAGQAVGDVQLSGLKVEHGGDLYRNREILTNVQATETFVRKFVGDGSTRSWTLPYPVAVGTIPFLTLNGASGQLLTVGIKGQDTGKDYYYTPGGTGIDQDSGQSVLTPLNTLQVTWSGTYTTDVVRDNTGGFPGTVSQSQYAAIDGTSGIIEDVLDMSQSDATAHMTVAQAEAYGDTLLQTYGVIGDTVTFTTFRQGLTPGQQVPLFLPAYGLINAQGLVTQVDTSAKIGPDGGALYSYAVTVTQGPSLGDWVKLFSSVFG